MVWEVFTVCAPLKNIRLVAAMLVVSTQHSWRKSIKILNVSWCKSFRSPLMIIKKS